MLNLRALSSETALVSGFTTISAFRAGPARSPAFDMGTISVGAVTTNRGIVSEMDGEVPQNDSHIPTTRRQSSVYSSTHTPESGNGREQVYDADGGSSEYSLDGSLPDTCTAQHSMRRQ